MMREIEINVCPATLAKGYDTFSPIGLKRMFDGRRVSHLLKYDSAGIDEVEAEKFIANRVGLSISGVQEKMSFLLDQKTLRLTEERE